MPKSSDTERITGRKCPDKIGKPVGKDFQVSEWQPVLRVGAKALAKPQ